MKLNLKNADDILFWLDGWKIVKQTKKNNTKDNNDYSELETNHEITKKELEFFYEETLDEVSKYLLLELEEFPKKDNKKFYKGVCKWTAGLLWRKYNIRANDQVDETNTLGYGDELIISAKSQLKPYKYKRLSIW